MDSTQEIIFLSGVIEQDTNEKISIPVGNSYTLKCKSYEISRENKITQYFPLSNAPSISLNGSNALIIKAKGKIVLDSNNIIETLNSICENTSPFTLIIGTQSFSDIILKSYTALIDGYGISADCSLVFVKVGSE